MKISQYQPNETVENMASILLRTGNEYKADHHGPLQLDRYESKTFADGSRRPIGAGQLCACSASLVDQLDLSQFDAHYQNDKAGPRKRTN
jgi:hypothetical protein